MQEVYVHPTALVETDLIGPGTVIWAYSNILSEARIGANCRIGDHCFIESGVVIGDNVTIKNGNALWTGVELEDGVYVGPQVTFGNDRHPRSPRLAEASARYADPGWLAYTLVQYGASLGGGSVILPGVVVGPYAMVEAGAVVSQDVPAHASVGGNPARLRGWVCQCGLPLRFNHDMAECAGCGLVFSLRGEDVRALPRSR